VIVECQNCTTRFQLDELLIPLAGIRVRCSKCKEAFFLEHPSASPDEVVEQVAFDAVAGESPASLGTTQDLVVPPRGEGVEEDEDSWEFNHDGIGNVAHEPLDEEVPRSEVETGTASDSEAASDEVIFDGLENDISGLDVIEIDDSIDCKDSFDTGAVFDHNVVGDLAGSVHPDGSSPPDRGGATDRRAGSVASASDSLRQVAEDEVHGEVDLVAGDLGDPEDWDLLGDDLSSPALSVSPPEVSPAKSSATTQTSSPEAAATDARVPVSAAMSRRKPAPGMQGGLRYAANVVGWIVTLGLLVLTFGLGTMRSVATDPSSTATAFPVGALRAQSIQTEWFPTTQGGTLLVVHGELHNPMSVAVKPPPAVIVSLLDSEGVALDVSGVGAGRPLDPAMLRHLSADGLEHFAGEARAVLLATPLPPETSVPFAAYFSDVPVEAQRVFVRGVGQGHPSDSEFAAQ